MTPFSTFPLYGTFRVGKEQRAVYCSHCQSALVELALDGDDPKYWEVTCKGDGTHEISELEDQGQ